MPVEIKELLIKTVIGNGENTNATSNDGEGSADKDAIIAECVEQVLQILKEKTER